jgi:Protein of unknown function (DUF4238)
MTVPRKHHYVPQSLLRQFAVPSCRKLKQVYVYSKEDRRSFQSSVVDAGAERDFYSVDIGTSQINWEPAFQQLDDRLAEVLLALTNCNSLVQIDASIRADIPLLVATQMLRTQMPRTSVTDLVVQLNEIGEPLGVEQIDFSDNDTRRLHLKRLLEIQKVAELFAGKDILLLQSTENKALWISDNPVVCHNTFPYGGVGICCPGVEMYFPVSSTRCLALYCPSIGEQIRESLDLEHLRPMLSNPFYQKLLRGIDNGTLVPISDDFISFLNELQIQQSSRFLYSSNSDFSLAELVLDANPSLERVTSLSKLGEFGAAPPPLQGMPAGTFLLLERGYRHDILSVVDCSDQVGRGNIAVTIIDELKFSSIDTANIFDSATLIVDGHAMQMMREVLLTRGVKGEEDVLAVTYADSSLQAMMESMAI